MRGARPSVDAASLRASLSEAEKSRHESEKAALLALFLACLEDGFGEDSLYGLCEGRAEAALSHALDGLGVGPEEAARLLAADPGSLSERERGLRDRIEAAMDNLADFAVCEEYRLCEEAMTVIGDGEIDFEGGEYEELLALFDRYNGDYALIENSDISYAGKVAAWWLGLSAADYVVYWTQNDAKVRPWHMALQGYAAPRDEFPSWMIPPIEYNCRCFLSTLEYRGGSPAKGVRAAARPPKKPSELSGVYSESLARCGRIFGPDHPYFDVDKKAAPMLARLSKRIKDKWHGKD